MSPLRQSELCVLTCLFAVVSGVVRGPDILWVECSSSRGDQALDEYGFQRKTSKLLSVRIFVGAYLGSLFCCRSVAKLGFYDPVSSPSPLLILSPSDPPLFVVLISIAKHAKAIVDRPKYTMHLKTLRR